MVLNDIPSMCGSSSLNVCCKCTSRWPRVLAPLRWNKERRHNSTSRVHVSRRSVDNLTRGTLHCYGTVGKSANNPPPKKKGENSEIIGFKKLCTKTYGSNFSVDQMALDVTPWAKRRGWKRFRCTSFGWNDLGETSWNLTGATKVTQTSWCITVRYCKRYPGGEKEVPFLWQRS